MNASVIERALAKRYAAPEYAFLVQVRNGTGYQRTVRTADAIAFGLYPSRGLTITGFEIKVSKADWKRELENPDKAEDIARFCHTWNIVAPKGVVPVDELPTNWGLVELGSNGKLRTAKAAVVRQPEPLTPLMIASIMRNVSSGMIPRSSIQEQIDEAVEAAQQAYVRNREYLDREHASLKEMVATFEEASGVHISRWQAGDIGRAVKAVLHQRTDPEAYARHLNMMRANLQLLDNELESAIEQIAPSLAGGSDCMAAEVAQHD